MNDKEIKELLKHEYPEFDNKGNEIYELVSNKRKRPFLIRKKILISIALMVITLLIIFTITFNGNKRFKKICDGVYVSASTLDLSGEIDMSICEGIVLEEEDIVYFIENPIAPRRTNLYHGFPFDLLFSDENLIFKIYCTKGYICVNFSSNGSSEEIIGNKKSIQWSPFKNSIESLNTTDSKKNLNILRKNNNAELYILCIKNNLIIGMAIVDFNLDIPTNDPRYYTYCINGKILASYIFKDSNGNIYGISKKQLLMIIKQIKKGN